MFRAALKNDVKLTTNIRAPAAVLCIKAQLKPERELADITTTRHSQIRSSGVRFNKFSIRTSGDLRSLSTSIRRKEQLRQDGDDDIPAPNPPLSIVFTDIVKSTAIWEKDADTMAKAMRIHDDLVRETIRARKGYEVKQNGDGFMIAFQSAICALRFCLDVQIKLQDQDWPEPLLELGPAQPVIASDSPDGSQPDHHLWKGLRLRMSAHSGSVVCNWNGVIDRMDYLGPAVNRAARFVGVCEGGQIVVSEEFLDALRIEQTETLAENGPLYDRSGADGSQQQKLRQLDIEGLVGTDFEVCDLGERHFKGVQEKQKLYFIVPKSLQGRLEWFPKHNFVQASKGNLV